MVSSTAARERWLFWLVALLVLGAGLGLRDPWPADEPRFALVARQMVESGQWLFPMRGDELYPDKPPLFMWLQAIAYEMFGDWRVAFLLPSLLASLATLWCVVDLGARLWTRRVGLYAGWALLFALQFTWQSKRAQIDPLVTCFITLANYGLLRHLLRGPDWRMWTLGWAAAGLGTITKGVGVIALLMLLPAVVASLRGWPVRLHARDVRWWLGPLAFVVACALWLVPMLLAVVAHAPEYDAYARNILFRQTAVRYADAWHHHQPPWYYLEVMAATWLPALLALPWAIPAWRRRLRRRDPRYLLPLAWWWLVLLFFTLSPGKRDVYILPALPMACLALAPLLPGIVRKPAARALAFGFAALLAAAFLGVGLAMVLGEPGFEQDLVARRGLEGGGELLAAFFVSVGAWGVGVLAWAGWRRAVGGMLAVLAGTWVLFGLVGAPVGNDSASSRGLMGEVGAVIGPDAELGLVGWREQQLLMADRPASTFGFAVPFEAQLQRGLAWQAAAPGRRWLLVLDAAMPPCIDRGRALRMDNANRRGWWLVPGVAATHCDATGGR
ncbi:MAG TPA: glycosyltransferase family 39 protein [Xanthomonadaceae bacterium]|nr:glycosyltransferase family 39 protein [Xanthomonadaceae bacterium]